MRYHTFDAGYDYEPIYEQVHRMGYQPVIAYNKRNEGELLGYDKHFAPTCFREHSYRYDSFDPKYETLKYTRPKECSDCPLANEGICQEVYKVKITQDLRKYTAPACGSQAWTNIFKRRTAVERVNAYLKEFFQLNNLRNGLESVRKFILTWLHLFCLSCFKASCRSYKCTIKSATNRMISVFKNTI